MLSNLGPLFKTVFRETERTDARLEIRREEKQNNHKNKGRDKDTGEDNALWEDSTGVSVTALRTFLIGFLREKGGQSMPLGQAEHPAQMASGEQGDLAAPSSAVAARAAQAYGATAAHTHHVQPPSPQETDDLASLLESDEVRAIHRLITELVILERAGVETLTFQLNGTFLDSVAEAVRVERTMRGI